MVVDWLPEDASGRASELPLLYLPGVPTRLADADRGIYRFRLVRSLRFLPDEIRHAKRHDGCGASGGIVHMPAKAHAFLACLLSLFDKLNLDIFASTIRALHNRPFSCKMNSFAPEMVVNGPQQSISWQLMSCGCGYLILA